mmetsp:Transcript_14745/g.36899  ORF Transcript_14745/g.36899 Transcript_14745/m.36899 type:complete len:86 (+) Transcript_14745:680-937(+)
MSTDDSPLSLLSKNIFKNRPMIIFLRNNRKLLGYLRAYDKHLNLILENVKELKPISNKKKQNIYNERFFSKLVLRGDSVILIIPI